MADAKRLELTRRAHRGQMTKLSKRGAELLINLDDDENLELLAGIVDSMENKLRLLGDLDRQITDTTPEENLEGTIIEADEYLEGINVKVRKLKTACKNARPEAHDGGAASNISILSTPTKRTNLPKLTLPRFDGNLLQWISFIDGFKASVASDNNLDDVQKFQYLRSQLDDEAARTVAGLPLSNANYMEAMALLERRYGQPHKIISTYMKALWELPKPADSVSSIKDFFDNMETYIRGLRALGKTEDAYGDLLVPVVFDKLPNRMKTQISREHGDKAWTLPELRDAIYREIEANLAGEPSTPTPSTATFMVRSKSKKPTCTSDAPTTKQCAYCKGNHWSTECMKYKDQHKRYDLATHKRLCFNCLKENHSVQECFSKGRCRNCHKKHHTSLCKGRPDRTDYKQGRQDGTSPNTKPSDAPPSTETLVTLTPTVPHQPNATPVLLKTASARIWVNNTAVTVNILLDEGAQRTFITESATQQLDYRCSRREDISLSTFGAKDNSSRCVDVAEIKLETKSGMMLDISALVVSRISTPVKNYVQLTIRNHPYLQGLDLADHVDKDTFEIDLLIGADYYWSIVEDKVIRGSGPTAVSSKLGFLLSGPSGLKVSMFNTMVYKTLVSTPEASHMLQDYWDLETIGITNTSQEDTCSFKEYRDSHLHLKDGRYVAELPWRSDHPPLPTNHDICQRRTRAMVKRLPEKLRRTYDKIITDQLARGFIEPVPVDDATQGHYIPHHPVHKDSTTTPIRVVYDCSCKHGGNPSLNDCLHVGQSLTKDLVEILLRFRLHPVGFVSDIEKAFLNVELNERDRNYTKFLWLLDAGDPESELVTFRFKAVLFGSVSSPFILASVLKTHLELSSDKITKDVLENTYVDNLVSGTSNEQEAVAYYTQAVHDLKQAGFNLRSWASNNATLQDAIAQDGKLEQDTLVKVLGMYWNTEEDTLTFKEEAEMSQTFTKREVVKETSSIFDPIGLLSPVHIQAKIFIQKLWQANLQWDDPLCEELQQEWLQIRDDLESARGFTIRRPYFLESSEHSSEHELHVFADASPKAYGAVVYLKTDNECAFVMSKTRVKPLKDVSLPRLELLAAFVAARLAQFVSKALSGLRIKKLILWSDSQIVLHWLQSRKKLPTFIKNRVKVIRATPFSDFKYCPSGDNPADLLTCGITSEKLEHNKLWMHGPSWLLEGDWPVWNTNDDKVLTCQSEPTISDDQQVSDEIEENPPLHDTDNLSIASVMEITRYSSLGKLFRITAYVLRFIRALRKQTKHASCMGNTISVSELDSAERLWIRSIQSEAYPMELKDIKTKVRKKHTLVHQLKLFINEHGLLRCGGRLHNANIEYNSKHPILIPRGHYFTDLVVKWAHSSVLHAGLGNTVSFIRNKFWIPRIRQVTKGVLRSCVTCRKVFGKSYRMPETPPLPKCRLEESPAFTITGVDFTGVLYYKSNSSTSNKAYICLFTCAVTRAIHLEVVTDMTTKTFIQAFRRFAARKSLPRQMISDNGSTFLAGSEEIHKICADSEVHNYLASKNVEWTFIPKRAPWFGGFYERLIGITKNALKKNLGHRLVTLDELITLTTELEAIINDRPITYLSSSLEEPVPLTPSMLLHGRRIYTLPHLDVNEEEVNDADFGETLLQKRSKQLDLLFKHLWSRWKEEYLPALREAHMHNAKDHKGDTVNIIKTGDVVLVHEDTRKRVLWPLAVVTKLKHGNYGLVRSAEIRMKGGLSNRPIRKLYPLEVGLTTDSEDSNREVENVDSHDAQLTTKPVRHAAIKARSVIREWSNLLK